MHPDDRKQIDELLASQNQLHREMERLDACLHALTTRLGVDGTAPELRNAPPVSAVAAAVAPPVVAPVSTPASQAVPPPLPKEGLARQSRDQTALEGRPLTETQRHGGENSSSSSSVSPRLREKPKAPPAPVANKGDTLELQLGTVWLVRLSVVILLTGLVFLGNYAYHNFIGKMGPSGRLALLYLAGGGLCAIGAWLERGKASLGNYSRVLMGGGVATIYYATYAAYFVKRLQVIDSPMLAGGLLLVLAVGIVGLADRKRSEILATFAVLLSFYTGTVNPIAEFILFSDLLLTAIAVLFLIRRQWTTLSFLSVAGAYVSFGFWRYFHTGCLPWQFAARSHFWPGILILTCYWGLFTAGLFLCGKFPPGRRMAFLSSNNGAYFALATTLIHGAWPAQYWAFPCGLGAACLVLAWLAQRRMRDELLADGAYLAQGLMLITLGVAIKLAGYQLALMLAVEGAVLLTCCRQRHGWIYRGGAAAVSAGAFILGVARIAGETWLALPLGGVLALLFLYDARWIKRLDELAGTGEAKPEPELFAAFFVAMALVCGGLISGFSVAEEWQYPLLAMAAVFCAYSLRLHGLLELAILAQGYLLWAGLSWIGGMPDSAQVLPWWNPALLVVGALSMVHWWHGQPPARQRASFLGQTVAALGMVALLHHWLDFAVPPAGLLVVLPVIAIVMVGYGVFTRTLALQLAGQLFVVMGAICYFRAFAEGHAPSAGLAALAFMGVLLDGMAIRWAFENSIWFDGSPALEPGGVPLLEGYRFLAMGMYVMWAFQYVPERWWFAFFSFSALGLLGAGVWSHQPWRIRRCAILLLLALWVFWSGQSGQVSSPNTAAILVLLAVYHIVKRPAMNWPGLVAPWRDNIAYILLATLWLLVTRWVHVGDHQFYTTVAWSVLAAMVLGSGFVLHERSHRRAGMILLALAVGRILIVDVWALETGFRIASFLVLGLVLSLLGFVYNRFADRIRTLE